MSLIILMVIGINIRASNEGILFDEKIMEYVHQRTTTIGIEIMKKNYLFLVQRSFFYTYWFHNFFYICLKEILKV